MPENPLPETEHHFARPSLWASLIRAVEEARLVLRGRGLSESEIDTELQRPHRDDTGAPR